MGGGSSGEDDNELTTLPGRTNMSEQHYLLNDVAQEVGPEALQDRLRPGHRACPGTGDSHRQQADLQ